MLSGFTLRYTGKKFSPDELKKAQLATQPLSGADKLRSEFSEIGALAIRNHITHGQRLGLIQQICREDYATNPVDMPAPGHNQDDLFAINPQVSRVRQQTRLLEEYCHYTVGRGKVLNERAQPLVHTNTAGFRGEQLLWDILHTPVWGTGINFAHQLTKQGFVYLCHPQDLEDQTYESISAELAKGLFDILPGNTMIKLSSGLILEASTLTKIEISFDASFTQTQQANGLIISAQGVKAPLGWMLHLEKKKIIEQGYVENIMRVLKLAKHGFYEMTKEQQALQQSGFLKNTNGLALFAQNQAFNAMDMIFELLEKEFNFDPSPLMSNSLQIAFNRLQTLMKESEIVEDLLTGALQTEMVQHLRKTQPNSTRSMLPRRFTNPFNISINNVKAIAYAFDVKKPDGTSVLKMKDNEPPVVVDPSLTDVRINGRLINPTLNNTKHIAALLSTAILVSEQMILEQLLRDACRDGDDHPNADALNEILSNDTLYVKLKEIASKLPSDEQGPILGLQFTYCDELVALLRQSIGTQHLCSLAEQLYQQKQPLIETDHPEIVSALRRLMGIAAYLQTIPSIAVTEHQVRGVNSGLIPVIEKLAPALFNELVLQRKIDLDISENDSSKSQAVDSEQSDEFESCPYLSAVTKRTSAQSASQVMSHDSPLHQEAKKPMARTWCSYFAKAVPIVIGAGIITSYAIDSYMKDKFSP